MQKLILPLFLFLLIAPAAFASEIIPRDKTPWGSTVSQVNTALGNPLETTPASLTYPFEFKEDKGHTIYYFEEEGLKSIEVLVGKVPGKSEILFNTLIEIFDKIYAHSAIRNKPCAKTEKCTGYVWSEGNDTVIELTRTLNNGHDAVRAYWTKSEKLPPSVEAAQPAPVYSKALKGQDKAFAEAVQKRIADRRPFAPYGTLIFDEDGGTALYAGYKLEEAPLLLDEPKQEAREILVYMVEELQKLGINPADEQMFVSVRLYKEEKGLTGKDLIRLYGRWQYNPFTDQAEWEPAK